MPFNREFLMHRNDEMNPLLTLHREMNRVFEEVFRGTYDPANAPFDRHGIDQGSGWQGSGWPHIEVAKTGKEIKVIAELPGLDEKDVRVELSNHVLTIDGEKKSEIEEHNRWFSERYHGHFERRIPLDWDVDEDKVGASFRNGVLTVTLPKSTKAQEHTKRISVNNGG
jgi:HSP20 family protein